MHNCFRRYRSIIAALILLPGVSLGHSPHHVVTDVAASRIDTGGSDVFILITDQLLRSDEQGSSWKNLANGLNNRFSFTSIRTSPAYEFDQTVFVATAGDGVYQSTNSGQSWRLVNDGLVDPDIARLSVSSQYANDRRVLAAATSGGVWRRSGDDPNWQMVLTENVQVAVFFEYANPAGEAVVYAGDSRGRIWQSLDSGRLWQIVNELPEHPAITSIAAKGSTIFVGTGTQGLYRSDDLGHIFSRVAQLRPMRRMDCRGNELEQAVADPYITSVSFSPRSAGEQKIFVTTWYDGVFVSSDNGDTWSKWSDGLSCDQQGDDMHESHFRIVVSTPTEGGQTIYWVGTFDGLFRSTGIDSQWRQLETLPLALIKGMAVTGGPNRPLSIALATYGGGFYLTEDRGSTWTIGNKGLQTTRLTGLSFSPDYAADGVIFAGASRRLLRSADRGQSWERINLQPPSFGRRVVNKLASWGLPTGWLRSSDDEFLQVYPTFIVQPPDSGGKRVLFATRFDGVMGYDHATGEIVRLWSGTDEIMNSLEISSAYKSDHTLFASIRDQGAIRSEDSGNRWTAINEGLGFTTRWSNSPGGGDFRRDVLIAISPDYESDHTVYAGSPAGDGLYVSNDRGDTWVGLRAVSEIHPAPVLAIALSPQFAADRSMMISIKGEGIFRSSDGGESFSLIGEQLVRDNASIEWLTYSPDFSNDRTVVAASDEALFISDDGGDSWTTVSRPVRYEDMRDVISYTGKWERANGEGFSAMTETSTTADGSRAHLHFVGGGIRWLGSCGPEHGTAQVYLDDKWVATVPCHEETSKVQRELFISDKLEYGAHTIEIRAGSAESGDPKGMVSLDAFDVLPASSAAH